MSLISRAAILVLTVFTLHLPAASAEDWPRFLGARYDGVAKDPGFDWSQPPLFRWALPVGDGYGIGSVADGNYYHFDAGPAEQGFTAERLRCIDLNSGETLWTKTDTFIYSDMLGYEDGPRTSATVNDDLVYTLGVAGKLSCRKTGDGSLVWSIDTNRKYGVVQNFFGVGSSPLVLEDLLIVMVGGSPAEDQKVAQMRLDLVRPNGSAVVALDLRTGAERWTCGNDLASYSSPRPIEIDGQMYVLVFAREGLILVDPREGTVRWRFDHRSSKLESVNAMTPVVNGDLVLISECYEVGSALLKVTADDYELVWRDTPSRVQRRWLTQNFRSHWATPLLIDGYLYGGSGRNPPDSDFRCIDFRSGQVQWSDPRGTRSTATQVGDHLLVLEERGLFQVVRPNPKGLDVVAQWQLDRGEDDRPALSYPCWAAPIVVGNKLMVRGTSNVLCLELASHDSNR